MPASRSGRIVLAISALTTPAWLLAAVVMSGRGLDLTDEGFYLLSYRWWDSNPASFTAVQYVWGPIFSATGYDVQVLRLLRLVAVVAVHGLLGLASWRWLREVPGAQPDRPSRAVVIGALVASGGIVQGWGPLTPGYNDTALLASLVLLSACLALQAAALRGERPGHLWPLVCGPAILVLSLAKWSTAILVVPLLVLGLVAGYPRGRRQQLLRPAGTLLVSLAGSAVIFHLLVKPWPELVAGLVPVIDSISAGSNSPSDLLPLYVKSTARVISGALIPMGGAVGLVILAQRLRPTPASGGVAPWGPPLALFLLVGLSGGLHGGVAGAFWYTAALVGVAGATWLLARRAGNRDGEGGGGVRPLTLVLLLLPAVQAAGTGNPLYYLAVGAGSTWILLLLLLWTRAADRGSPVAAAGTATCLLVVGWVATTGPLFSPYRTTPVSSPTAAIVSESAGELGLDSALIATVDQLSPYVSPGAPVMAFDELAGLVLLLDGRSVGEAWYSRLDPERTAAGIRRYCENAAEPWARGLPVVISDRPLGPTELDALATCGLDSRLDFRRTKVAGAYDLTVLVPLEAARG